MKKLIDKSLLPFLLIGAGNTLLSQLMMQGLMSAGAGYWLSSGIAFFLTSVLSFILNRRFSFHSRAPVRDTLWRFALNIAVCWLLAYSVARPATAWLLNRLLPDSSLDVERVSLLTGQVLFTALNYFGQKFFAFRKRGHDGPR